MNDGLEDGRAIFPNAIWWSEAFIRSILRNSYTGTFK